MKLHAVIFLAGALLSHRHFVVGEPQDGQQIIARGSNVYGAGAGFDENINIGISPRDQPIQGQTQDQPQLPVARQPDFAPSIGAAPNPVAPLALSDLVRSPQPNIANPAPKDERRTIGLEEVDLQITSLTTGGQEQPVANNELGAGPTAAEQPAGPQVIGSAGQGPATQGPSLDNVFNSLPPQAAPNVGAVGVGAINRNPEIVVGFERNSAQAGGEYDGVPLPLSPTGYGEQEQPEIARGGDTYGAGRSVEVPKPKVGGDLNIEPEQPRTRDRVLSQPALPEEDEAPAAPVRGPAPIPNVDIAPQPATRAGEEHHMGGIEWLPESIPGEPLVDYPVLVRLPASGFDCNNQDFDGFYADTSEESRCQAFWVCHNEQQDGFLCPNGTLFNQRYFTCDWWFNVRCQESSDYYELNKNIGVVGTRIDTLPAGVVAAASKLHPVFTLLSEMLRYPRLPPVPPPGKIPSSNNQQLPKSRQTQAPAVQFKASVNIGAGVQARPASSAHAPEPRPLNREATTAVEGPHVPSASDWQRSSHSKSEQSSVNIPRIKPLSSSQPHSASSVQNNRLHSPSSVQNNPASSQPEETIEIVLGVNERPKISSASAQTPNSNDAGSSFPRPGNTQSTFAAKSRRHAVGKVQKRVVKKQRGVRPRRHHRGHAGSARKRKNSRRYDSTAKNRQKARSVPGGPNIPQPQNIPTAFQQTVSPGTNQSATQNGTQPAKSQPVFEAIEKIDFPLTVDGKSPPEFEEDLSVLEKEGNKTLSSTEKKIPMSLPIPGQLMPPGQTPQNGSKIAVSPINETQSVGIPSVSPQSASGLPRQNVSGPSNNSNELSVTQERLQSTPHPGGPLQGQTSQIKPQGQPTPVSLQGRPSKTNPVNLQGRSTLPTPQGLALNTPAMGLQKPSNESQGQAASRSPWPQEQASQPILQASGPPPLGMNPGQPSLPPQNQPPSPPAPTKPPSVQSLAQGTELGNVPTGTLTGQPPSSAGLTSNVAGPGPPHEGPTGVPSNGQPSVPASPTQILPTGGSNGVSQGDQGNRPAASAASPPQGVQATGLGQAQQGNGGIVVDEDVQIDDGSSAGPLEEKMHYPPLPGTAVTNSQGIIIENPNPGTLQQRKEGVVIDEDVKIDKGGGLPPVEEDLHFPALPNDTLNALSGDHNNPSAPLPGSGVSGPHRTTSGPVRDPSALHHEMPSETDPPLHPPQTKTSDAPMDNGAMHGEQIRITSKSVGKMIRNPSKTHTIRDPSGLQGPKASLSGKFDKDQSSSHDVGSGPTSKDSGTQKRNSFLSRRARRRKPQEVNEIKITEEIDTENLNDSSTPEPDKSSDDHTNYTEVRIIGSLEPPSKGAPRSKVHKKVNAIDETLRIPLNGRQDGSVSVDKDFDSSAQTADMDSGSISRVASSKPLGINLKVFINQVPANASAHGNAEVSRRSAGQFDEPSAKNRRKVAPVMANQAADKRDLEGASSDDYDYDISQLPSWMRRNVKRGVVPARSSGSPRSGRAAPWRQFAVRPQRTSPLVRVPQRDGENDIRRRGSLGMKRAVSVAPIQTIFRSAREQLMGILGGPKDSLDSEINTLLEEPSSGKDKRQNEMKLRFDSNSLTSYSDKDSSWF